jgi:Tol biopolymer transport system component
MRRVIALACALGALAAAATAAPPPRERASLRTTCGRIDDGEPAWSTYGDVLAFTRRVGDGAAIYRIDADGARLRRLSLRDEYATQPVWSPDAAHVAYVAFGRDALVSVVVVSIGGEHVVVDSYQGERTPPHLGLAWSNLGDELAYSRNGWIYRARADGSGVRRFVEGTLPAWRPSSWYGDVGLAYVTTDGRLALVEDNGAGFRTVADGLASAPEWSPDGKRLAYAYVDARTHATNVAVVDATSGASRRVDSGATQPHWSLDGSRLVDVTTGSANRRPEVHVVDLRTGRVRVVTRDGSLRFGADDVEATWSISMKKIVVASANLGRRGATMNGGELRLVTADGRREWRLTYHCATGRGEINGSWLPDIVLARNGVRDYVACAGGYDVVYAERRDRVRPDCESVRYAPSRRGT